MVYICKYCNKKYKSSHSRSNHYRIYHKIDSNPKVTPESSNSNPKVTPESSNSNPKVTINLCEIKNFTCRYCDKMYKYKQGKYKHEQSCKNKELKEDNNKIAKLEKENLEIKNTLSELLKLCKIHPKTLQKINNQLVNGSINNGTINKTINNGTINNTVNIVKFGTEELNKILTQFEILKILNKKMCSLEESIKMIHFNDARPEFRNIYITNLKDQYAYIYDGNKFIAVLKSDILETLVDNHIENIEYSADEYKEKLNEKTIEVLDKFIDKMNNEEDEFIDKQHKKSYPNFKSYNINEIKLMIYNMSNNKTNVVNVISSKNEIPIYNKMSNNEIVIIE